MAAAAPAAGGSSGSGASSAAAAVATPSPTPLAAARDAAAAAESQQHLHQQQQQQQQQQMLYTTPHHAAQGIYQGYPGMLDGGGPVDPSRAQVAAFANQAAIYGPYGSPYALNMPPPPTGGPYYPGLGAQFAFPSSENFALPGPAYYDPYGMLNPASCITPLPAPEGREGEAAKQTRRKGSKKWFGCC